MKAFVVAVSASIAFALARAANPDESEGSLLRYLDSGKLTPERAAQHPPADQFGYLRDEHEYTYIGSVQYEMRTQAAFFAEYTKQLKTLTEKTNPAAAAARAELIDLLGCICSFIWHLDSHRNYDDDRTPAFAEWLLYSAKPNFFLPHKGAPVDPPAREAAFTTDDVRTFVRTIAFTRMDYTGTPAEQIADKATKEILARLSAFERHLNEDGKRHFRFQIIRFTDNIFAALYDNGEAPPHGPAKHTRHVTPAASRKTRRAAAVPSRYSR